jgi:hypothetical protein
MATNPIYFEPDAANNLHPIAPFSLSQSASSSALTGTEISFLGADYLTKTLNEDTTFTITNPGLGKTVCLILDGDYTITMPSSVTDVGDLDYDGTITNYIYLQCVDESVPKYLMTVIR